MNLQQRISILVELGKYMMSNDTEWLAIQQKAFYKNNWFTPDNITLAIKNIVSNFLEEKKLQKWVINNEIPENNDNVKTVGLVAAGNIPLVCFHDFLCIFISGNKQIIKLSSKDDVLLSFLVQKMEGWNPEIKSLVQFAENLKGADAYIATGSNNAGRYFEYYFSKYPSIIRKNRTSVAFLNGNETTEELNLLTEDIHAYFGLGCRNVTMLYVPVDYDFVPLVNSLKKHEALLDFQKYKNNYDYQLAILLLNKKFYMSGGGLLLEENESIFSPISVIHYQYYNKGDEENIITDLQSNEQLQAVIGEKYIPFGSTQTPSLEDYADGVNTLIFLKNINIR